MPQIQVNINICDSIYLRDPSETTLGKKLLEHAINLLSEIGFEEFNFKKLATRMSSTEASIYRYFENKYKLLSYLVAWYWDYMHFLILLDTRNINHPLEKLDISIVTLVNTKDNAVTPAYINLRQLHAIVVENASKVYHNKQVDELIKVGFYENLQKLVRTLSKNILEINKDFKYPNTLATNIIELSLNNEFYTDHFPGLTDVDKSTQDNSLDYTVEMVKYFVLRLLK